MTWYYADGGQPKGPVEETELDELYRQGKVRADTLVWHEGMANWQPLSQVKTLSPGAEPPAAVGVPPLVAGLQPAASLGPDQVLCAECGQVFKVEETVPFGSIRVCAACKPVLMQKLAEGAKLNTPTMTYGGFWIRVGAKLLDGLIIGLPFLVPLVFFAVKYGGQQPTLALQLGQLIFQLGYMAANIVYQIFFLGKYGATPGKMICNLRVVTAEGEKLTYGRATGRCFAEILSGMICDIGYLIAAWDDQKRTLHDHICNTRVVLK